MSLLHHVCATTWSIEHTALEKLLAIVERHDAAIKLDDAQIRSAIGRAPKAANPRDRTYDVHQGVAIVPVQGVIHKHAAQVQDVSGPSGTSYEQVLADVRVAMADPAVTAALLHIESPGGMSDGNVATSQAISDAATAAGKPVWTLIDGLGASAAYGLGVAGARVYATPSSQVGSIGTLMVMRDTSAAAEKAGIKTRVVRSAPLKGGAVNGEPITDAHIADAQRIVDGLTAQFAARVGERRGMSADALAAVTDGRVHLAADAQTLGLIDGVASLEQVLAMMTDPSQRQKPTTSITARPASAAATHQKDHHPMQIAPEKLKQLVSAHKPHAELIVSLAAGSADQPAASEAEILAAIQAADFESTRTALAEAQSKLAKTEGDLAGAVTAHAAAITAKDAQIATLTSELAEAKTLAGKKGTTALEGSATPPAPADAVQAYDAKAAELKAAGDKSPHRTIATKFPELNSAYVDAANAKPQKGATK